jgi:hypothetical protein
LFNVRLSATVGVIAFIVSFLLGIISGTRIPIVLLKALIFAVIFVVLSGGIYALISLYLPDLLSPGADQDFQDAKFQDTQYPDSRGSQVDISLDDQGGEEINSSYFQGGNENPGEFGDNQDILDQNIGTLSGDGLDQNREDGYTSEGVVETSAGTSGEETPPRAGNSSSETPGVMEDLPDFDSVAAVFGSEGAAGRSGGGASGISSPETFNAEFVGGPLKNKNTPDMGEDFDVKEMASAVQTILKREDKG